MRLLDLFTGEEKVAHHLINDVRETVSKILKRSLFMGGDLENRKNLFYTTSKAINHKLKINNRIFLMLAQEIILMMLINQKTAAEKIKRPFQNFIDLGLHLRTSG